MSDCQRAHGGHATASEPASTGFGGAAPPSSKRNDAAAARSGTDGSRTARRPSFSPFSESLRFDRRLTGSRVTGPRPPARPPDRRAAGSQRHSRCARQGHGGTDGWHLHVRADRRRSIHHDRAARDRARRFDGCEVAHRSQPQRPSSRLPYVSTRRRTLGDITRLVLELRNACCWTERLKPARCTFPGYTHMQRAQPVLLSHHLRPRLGTGRDVDRVVASTNRLDVSPLGAGRWLDRRCRSMVSPTNWFRSQFENSLDGVVRDFVAETLFDIALLGVHCRAWAKRSPCGRARSSGSSC